MISDSDLLQWVQQHAENNIVEFPEELLQALSEEQLQVIARELGASMFMRLPASDIRFFEWLKRADENVWNDLWNDDIQPEPYVVGLALLPDIMRGNRGFPICDLVNEPNFYFTHLHVRGEEAKPYLEALRLRLEKGDELGIPELFLLELTQAPIDIWRFAYLYRVSINTVKQAVMQLVEDELLSYTPTREELSAYLDFPDNKPESASVDASVLQSLGTGNSDQDDEDDDE